MNWEEYWKQFVDSYKLNDKISDMDEIDLDRNGRYIIKDICHTIYDEYPNYREDLEKIRLDLLNIVEYFPGVHLQTSRVKELDSLLNKIIKKRSDAIISDTNLYAHLDANNYKDILTDLTGVRLIISYRGRWKELHEKILEVFPYYDNMDEYSECSFIPHQENGRSVIAEIPIAYYAYDDDITMYKEAGIRTYLKENGYRSVHYVISFKGVYVEIQTRTIYDEAWSDFDHNYVYKHELHPSHPALKEMSLVLSQLTNAASDLGELMRCVYDNELIEESAEGYRIKDGYDLHTNDISDKIGRAKQLLDDFRVHIL